VNGPLSQGREQRRWMLEFVLTWAVLILFCLTVWLAVGLFVAWLWGVL
jgi:membrane protein insertase Oxa1/YidC/SpoIIIJ